MREEHYNTATLILKSGYYGMGAGTFGTCLHLAVAKLQIEHVKIILKYENANITESHNRETLFH